MNCKADIHYRVIRPTNYAGLPGEVAGLWCNFCNFKIPKSTVGQPRSSKSGRGRYNRMRAMMVRHLHKYHLERLGGDT